MKIFLVTVNIAVLLATSFNAFGADKAETPRQTDSEAKEREHVHGGGMALGVSAASANRFNVQSIEISHSVESAGSALTADNNGRNASARAISPKTGKQPLRFNPAPE
jgi:hypothetical protein